jgi:hypothetical protein
MKTRQLILCLGALHSGIAAAGPADYVYMPNVEYGEREIDFKYGNAEESDKSRSRATSLGLGYGATEYWFTEIYLKREHEEGGGLTLAEWENKFQLTETGKYPVDVGLITEIEAPLSDGHAPYEFKLGPLFQTEFGKLQLNGNLLFERKFGPEEEEDEPHETEMGYQWQIKYRWKPQFEFGAQGFGDMGKWNDWERSNQQSHKMGPAVFGKISLGQRQAIKYNAAWLFGTTNNSPDNNFRMQVEYEF